MVAAHASETGVRPLHPEIVVDTVKHSAEENAGRILAYLAAQGFISSWRVYDKRGKVSGEGRNRVFNNKLA